MIRMEPRTDLICFNHDGTEYAMTAKEIEAAYQYQQHQYRLEDAQRQLNALAFGDDDDGEFNDAADAQSKTCFEADYGITYEEAVSVPMLEEYLRRFNNRSDCDLDENNQWEAAIKAVLKDKRCA